jgi:crossover junction endodeoxyribonuclease RuvC
VLVLGIDPGLATTGYGFINETPQGRIEVIDYGAVYTPAHTSLEKRLLILYKRLKELILLHRPESAAVEKLFFQRNVKTAIAVGQARGVALLALAEADIEVTDYSPLEVKQAVTGYGGADKNQIQMMVKAILELSETPQPDDTADALAIAICHLYISRYKRLAQE